MRSAAITLAAITAVGLGACGDESQSTSVTSRSLPKAQFVQKANAACASFQQRAEQIPTAEEIGDREKAFAVYNGQLRPLVRRFADDMAAITPASDASARRWSEYVKDLRSAVRQFDTAAQKVRAGDANGAADALLPIAEAQMKVRDLLGTGACNR